MLYAAIAATITATANEVARYLPSGCTGSGEPSRRRRKLINGTMVQVWAIGHGDVRIIIELPYVTGTRPLTIAEAVELIAS